MRTSKKNRRKFAVLIAFTVCLSLLMAGMTIFSSASAPAVQSSGSEAAENVSGAAIDEPEDTNKNNTEETSKGAIEATAKEEEPEAPDAAAPAEAKSPEAVAPGPAKKEVRDGGITTQAELVQAVTDMEEGGTVKLTADIALNTSLILPTKSFILDGDNHKLTIDSKWGEPHIISKSNSYMTFKNINFAGKGIGTDNDDGGLSVKGDALIENCDFTGIYFSAHSLISNQYIMGHALNILGGNVTVNGCNFNGNFGVKGSGIYRHTSAGELTVSGCSFDGNSANYGGGAIRAEGTANVTINSSSFTGNSLIGDTTGNPREGGAIYTNGASLLKVTGAKFENNTAGDSGGAIACAGTEGTVQLTNSNFTGNSAGKGGALCASLINAVNCDFTGNEAIGGGGGAIYMITGSQVHPATYKIQGGSFVGNKAKTYGGAIDGIFNRTQQNGDLVNLIDGTEFSQNYAGKGYSYIDYGNPIDMLWQQGYDYASHSQTGAKEAYDKVHKDVTTWTEAPEGKLTSQHVMNNYDVSTGEFLVAVATGSGARWTNGSDKTECEIGSRSVTLENLYSQLTEMGWGIEKEGYTIVGWENDESKVNGYSDEDFAELGTDHLIRGPLYITPIWAKNSEPPSTPPTPPTPGEVFTPTTDAEPETDIGSGDFARGSSTDSVGTADTAAASEGDTVTVVDPPAQTEQTIDPPTDQIVDTEPPTVNFGDTEVPLYPSSGTKAGSWSLLNLILAIAGLVLALATTLRTLFAGERRGLGRWLLVACAAAAAGIIIFLLTQTMSGIMVMADMWTIAHAILACIGAASLALLIKDENNEYSPSPRDGGNY